MGRRAILPSVVVLLVVAAVGYWILHDTGGHQQEARKKTAEKEAKEVETRAVKEFLAKYNAVRIERKEIEFAYTLTLQALCIRSDGRPIAMYCWLEDVRQDGDAYVAVFWSPASDNLLMRFTCSAERAHSLVSSGPAGITEGMVVGRVKAIQTAVLGLQVSDDRESVELGPSGSSGCKVLVGELVDFLPGEEGT